MLLEFNSESLCIYSCFELLYLCFSTLRLLVQGEGRDLVLNICECLASPVPPVMNFLLPVHAPGTVS